MNETLDQKIRLRNAVARAHTQAASGQSTKMMVKETPVYSGRSRQVLPIVLLNLMLTFLTVGVYRFWAKTRLRRYFVSRVSFLGDPLEYGGTGMELFLGFLIVLTVLVPFFILSGIVQHFLARPGTDLTAASVFQATYLMAIYFLYNVAVYRAQRYRLSRVTWRGIHGGQQGSALLYALYAIGLSLLTLITLGLTYPLMRRALIGYRINRACFGSETFHFDGGLAPLVAAWLVPWLLMVLTVVPIIYTLWADGSGALTDMSSGTPRFRFERIRYVFLVPVGALGWVITSFWYRAKEVRYFAGFTRFEGLEFKSRLRGDQIFVPYLIYGLLLLLAIAGAFAGGIALIMGHFGTRPVGMAHVPPAVGMYLGFGIVIVAWLVLATLKPVIVQNWILRSLCRTMTIQGTFSPDRLFQNQLAIPRSGEGLADAFDVDAF